MMSMFVRFLLCLVAGCAATVQVAAQQLGPDEVLQRVEDGFRRAGGQRIEFSMNSSYGQSAGVIELKGEKFVLHTEGAITWFDGRTQWSYWASTNEVTVSCPTGEELQTLNPYAWLTLNRNGYRAKLVQPAPADGKAGCYTVQLTAANSQLHLQTIVLTIDKASYRPEQIVLQQGDDRVAIQVEVYKGGYSWPDNHFTFDSKKYPDAEVIDMR